MMKRKIGIIVAVTAAAVAAVLAAYAGMPAGPEPAPDAVETAAADVVMPTKVSRPGCEHEDRCYVPPVISTNAGKSVSWLNDDSAFHSVTSGYYGAPDGLFDSGYMDPGEVFTHAFDEPGEYAYYCTLHEWMRGTVLVN